MKIYFYSCKKNINSYLIINEATKEAILIDPCNIPQYFIEKIENEHISLKGACITNSTIEEIKRGVKIWQKIYNFPIFENSNLFNTNEDSTKTLEIFHVSIEAFRIKNTLRTFCMYKIENALFTGQSLLASIFQLSSRNEIEDKMQCFAEHSIIFPLSGPPTTLKNLKQTFTKVSFNYTLANVTIIP